MVGELVSDANRACCSGLVSVASFERSNEIRDGRLPMARVWKLVLH